MTPDGNQINLKDVARAFRPEVLGKLLFQEGRQLEQEIYFLASLKSTTEKCGEERESKEKLHS